MGTKWCQPAHNWSAQSTELCIICINIIVKGKCFDLPETNLVLLGLVCFQHFFLLKKIPQKFCYFILGQEARKLKCQKFPQKQNLMLWPGQALLYYAFIYFHFFQVISCLHRNESASCHCSEPSDLGLVALLRLMKGGRAGPSARSKKEFAKRELCTSLSAAVAGYAARWISSFECCTYKPRVQSRQHVQSDKTNPLKCTELRPVNLKSIYKLKTAQQKKCASRYLLPVSLETKKPNPDCERETQAALSRLAEILRATAFCSLSQNRIKSSVQLQI